MVCLRWQTQGHGAVWVGPWLVLWLRVACFAMTVTAVSVGLGRGTVRTDDSL